MTVSGRFASACLSARIRTSLQVLAALSSYATATARFVALEAFQDRERELDLYRSTCKPTHIHTPLNLPHRHPLTLSTPDSYLGPSRCATTTRLPPSVRLLEGYEGLA
ncbi:hypothetical protein GALMADRAFT_1140529 [Galerina marginata CBS 339.88]|uniref:Uncharacterized protein n=1 Tax=Galerina marginata (strain CBS 339.88) TaxID=685588 RepID=A0A067S7I9_GALM3|nr:hypothetical protein GALMADRAFT_1140529 [Galerina marginata CBS 339.88]